MSPMVSGLSDCPDVEDLFVGSEYRSRGIGSRLLDAAESLAVGKGYSRIGLGVSIDNARARSLYERRGYEDSEFGEYRVGDRYVDRDGRERSWEEVCKVSDQALELTHTWCGMTPQMEHGHAPS